MRLIAALARCVLRQVFDDTGGFADELRRDPRLRLVPVLHRHRYRLVRPFLSCSVHGSHLYRFVQVDLYGGAGSAINAVVPGKSSFGHRNKLLNFQMCTSLLFYAAIYSLT